MEAQATGCVARIGSLLSSRTFEGLIDPVLVWFGVL